MEGMMKPVELQFVTQSEANVLLANEQMWQPHGDPILDSAGVVRITLVRTIPIRFNIKPDAQPNVIIPQVRIN